MNTDILVPLLVAIVASLPGVLSFYLQSRSERTILEKTNAEIKRIKAESDKAEAERSSIITTSALAMVEELTERIDALEEKHEKERQQWLTQIEQERVLRERELAQERRKWQTALENERKQRNILEKEFNEAKEEWEKAKAGLIAELEKEKRDRESLKQNFATCTLKLEKLMSQIESMGGKASI